MPAVRIPCPSKTHPFPRGTLGSKWPKPCSSSVCAWRGPGWGAVPCSLLSPVPHSCAGSRPTWRRWRSCSRRWHSCRQPVRRGSRWSGGCAHAWRESWTRWGCSRWAQGAVGRTPARGLWCWFEQRLQPCQVIPCLWFGLLGFPPIPFLWIIDHWKHSR